MDEFIKLLDPAYELIQYRIKEDKVIFHIASTITVKSSGVRHETHWCQALLNFYKQINPF